MTPSSATTPPPSRSLTASSVRWWTKWWRTTWKLLRKEGKIDDRQIRALLGWKHSGFGAWRGEPISRHDRRAQENLAQYVMRSPFSVEKMTYVAETGTVLYRSEMSHGKHKKNFEVYDAPAFIAAGALLRAGRRRLAGLRRTHLHPPLTGATTWRLGPTPSPNRGGDGCPTRFCLLRPPRFNKSA